MKIASYMKRHKLKLVPMAKLTGVSISTISRAWNGYPIGKRSAEKIERKTDGAVTAAGLVYPKKAQP